MLLIHCPWCGPRNEDEFSYGGEAHIVRPAAPEAESDAQWADYLFMRFNVARDTVTHRLEAVYGMGEAPPVQSGGGG